MNNLKQLKEFIKAYYPWKSDSQVNHYIVHHTPWPIGSLKTIKDYIRTAVVSNWEEYVKEADSEGFDITEPPSSELKMIRPSDIEFIEWISVPVLAHREHEGLKFGLKNTQKPLKK